jgi:hypothetical protein
MKWLITLAVCSIGMNLSASTESGTDGTIVIANWTQKEIVFAADSRGTNGNSYHDTECKVAALGNKLIFAPTGRSRTTADRSWDVDTLAEVQFRALTKKRTPDRIAQKLAAMWGESVKKEFDSLPVEALSGIDDGHIAVGLFADFEKDGTLLIYVSDVNGVLFSPVGPPVATVRLIRGKGIDWVLPGACSVMPEKKKPEAKTQPKPKPK